MGFVPQITIRSAFSRSGAIDDPRSPYVVIGANVPKAL